MLVRILLKSHGQKPPNPQVLIGLDNYLLFFRILISRVSRHYELFQIRFPYFSLILNYGPRVLQFMFLFYLLSFSLGSVCGYYLPPVAVSCCTR